MKNEGAASGGSDIDSARLAATQFVADDVAVLLTERAATADVFAQMLAAATDAAQRGPSRGLDARVYPLLAFLHTRQSDAALEAMQLRRTALELIDRMSVLQGHSRRRGNANR